MTKRIISCFSGLLALAGGMTCATTLSTAFTYQGRLDYNASASSGYYDLQFELYITDHDGSAAFGPVTNFAVPVIKGLFTTSLDFGNAFNGTEYWLQIGVRSNATSTAFVALSPRQRLSPAPNALYASTAGSVASSSIRATELRTTNAPGAGQMLTYDGTSLVWQNPAALSGGWAVGGNSIAGGNFLGTVNNQDLIFKANNREALRLTATQDLLLQRPSNPPTFSVRNGLGVYGDLDTGWGSEGTRSFGNDLNLRGPVLYGESGGGLGVKSLSSVGAIEETLALKWDRFKVEIKQNAFASRDLEVGGRVGIGTSGTPQGPLDVRSGTGSFVRVDPTYGDFHFNGGSDGIFGLINESGSSGGTVFYGNNKLLLSILNSGNVGIGTASPDSNSKLHVKSDNGFAVFGSSGFEGVHGESTHATAAAVAGFNLSTGPGVYGESRGGGYGGYFVGKVRVGVLEIAGGADLAEPFPMNEEAIEKGSVVVIDHRHPGQLKRSTQAYDQRVAGIVSGANGINPGIALKQEGVLEHGENVALTGRVYVQADASFGAIEPGDLLTTSDTPGHAMKVTDAARAQGAILGKAMSTLIEGKGMVLVLVTLQ